VTAIRGIWIGSRLVERVELLPFKTFGRSGTPRIDAPKTAVENLN
jgi:hypothetical protein